MKQLITMAVLFISLIIKAQVGINNTSPKATLDITAKTTDGSKPEGLIAPRLTGNQIQSGTYGSAQLGTIIYATTAATAPTAITINITAPGYYYFDGSVWQKMNGAAAGDTTNDAWINDTTNGLVKLGTKADGTARTAGADFVAKDNGQIGIGTSSPNASAILEVNSSNKGILIPKVTLTSETDASTILSPATGLIVYNTASKAGGPGLTINQGTSSSPIWAALSTYSSNSGVQIGKIRYSGNPDSSKIVTVGNLSFRFLPTAAAQGYNIEMKVNSNPGAFSNLNYRVNRTDFYSANLSNQEETNLSFSSADITTGVWKTISQHNGYAGTHSNLIHISCDQDPIFVRLSTQERYGTLFSMVADLY